MASTDYLLPQLPFGSDACTIVRWLKRPGDAVSAGEPLLVVVNDRVEAALPATYAGILGAALAAEGAAVAAGAPVATIAAFTAANINDVLDVAQSTVRISPVAQRIVLSENIDITELQGTGISGRIMKADVLATLAGQAPKIEALPGAAPLVTRHSSRVTRHASLVTCHSSRVTRHASPDAYILTAIDVDLERVTTLIAKHGPSFVHRRMELSYIVCVALAAVAALPYHPLLNSYWADAIIVVRRRVHLAIVLCDGAPPRSVFDAQDLNLRGLARGLGSQATEHSSADCTFMIVDLGDHVWGDPAAWASGGAATLGLGAVRVRPLVIADGGVDRLAVRHAALLTLAYDARVLDQYYADAFLSDIKRRLEQFYF